MIRRLAPLPALLSVLALAGSAGATAPRQTVLLDGDSLAVGTLAYLPARLPGWRVRSSASVGRHTTEAVAVVRAARRLPPIVEVDAGTNDDPRDVPTFAAAVDQVVATAGPRRCVIWPSIVRPAVAGTSYRGLNRVLRRHRGRRFIVPDWTGLVARHPQWLGPDGVHPWAAGYEARAGAVARAVRRCAARLAAAG